MSRLPDPAGGSLAEPADGGAAQAMSLITYVTRIHFADHVLEHALESELEALGARRPLVLCDRDGARDLALGRLTLAIPRSVRAHYLTLTETRVTREACDKAAELYREQACDSLIAFGGAIACDLAKVAAIRITHEGTLCSYLGSEGGMARIRNVLPPLLAIPTVAGAGADVSGVALIAMEEGPNHAVVSPHLIPRVVICDPTLTLDLSPERTASTGMDALTHCMETFISSAFNPPADGMALDGMRRAFGNLERAVAQGDDLEARREVMAAGLNGALAQQKGLGGVHAMSNALCGLGLGQSDHGAITGVLLPLVLEFNAPAAGGRYEEIRRELALSQATGLGQAIVGLRERVGLPGCLSELGADAATLEQAACFAARDHANRTNPRKADASDYLALLQEAL
ncbi:iron-containing alcohol dehydrogenase [Aquibaculum sediminis]|uniref:iron-containing alcohol dehydrogenase n=1 Tax=Aquibaculum sediminis TaxID=3231907 RepID=UPI003451626F